MANLLILRNLGCNVNPGQEDGWSRFQPSGFKDPGQLYTVNPLLALYYGKQDERIMTNNNGFREVLQEQMT